MKYKVIVISIFLAALFTTAHAQSITNKVDSTKTRNRKGEFVASCGVGYSYAFTENMFFGSPVIELENDMGFAEPTSPVYEVALSYGLNKTISLGIAACYQTGAIGFDQIVYNNIYRLNAAGRILFHLNKHCIYFDHYLGIRAGFSYWGDDPVLAYDGTVQTPLPLLLRAKNFFVPSIQGLYGLTIYPGGGIFGFNAEIGIGTPYFAQAGILFRI